MVYNSRTISSSRNASPHQVLPRTPLALPIPLVPRRPPEGARSRLEFEAEVAGVDETVLALAPLETPRPRPLGADFVARVAASALLLSSSSAFRAAAAFLSCSSCSRLSAASCLA